MLKSGQWSRWTKVTYSYVPALLVKAEQKNGQDKWENCRKPPVPALEKKKLM